MRWIFPLIVAFGLNACSPERAAEDTISVRQEGGLFYRPIAMQWRASRDGRLEIIQESGPSPPSSMEKKQITRKYARISDQQFGDLKAVLDPVRQSASEAADGPCHLPDIPDIHVEYKGSDASWRWSSTDGCERWHAREVFGAAQDATAMLRRWTSDRPQ